MASTHQRGGGERDFYVRLWTLLLIGCVWLVTRGSCLKCPEGSLYHEETCIANIDQDLTYLQAEDKCKELSGALIIFTSTAMQREIVRWLRIYDSEAYSRRYWMGVRFEYVNKTEWMWVMANGKVLKPQDYQVWADSDVKDVSYPPCGVFRGGYWRHDPCDAKHPSLCQMKAKYCNVSNITVPHGYITDCRDDTTYLPAESVGIGCDEGCTLFGTPYITCYLDGTWSALPHCKPGCPPPDSVGHSNLAFSLTPSLQNFGEWFNVGHVLVVLCDEGFFYFDSKGFAKTRFVLQCEHDGTWTRSTPACIPLSQMEYSYSVHEVIKAEVVAGEDHVLTCADGTDLSHLESRVWLKDQVEVTSIAILKTKFEVSQNGSTLTLQPFNGDDGGGIYICITDLGVRGLRVTTYDIAQKNVDECRNVEGLLLKPKDTSVRTGTRLLLRCYSKNSVNTWYKNGVRVAFRRGLRTLPDGSLLVDRVQRNDRGKYTCLVAVKGTRCTLNATARVHVTGDSRSLCGFSSQLPLTEGPVTASAFPWLASLWLNDERRPFCYGSLLDDRWVLTSTTCVYGTHRFRLPPPSVRVGVDSTTDAPSAPLIAVDRIFTHPNYAWSNTRNDIALLRLDTRITLSEMVRPICLPPVPPPAHSRTQRSSEQLCEGDDQDSNTPAYGLASSVPGVVCGWGSVENRVKRNRHLRFERLHVVSRQTCQESVSFRLPASLFCAHSGEPANVTANIPDHSYACAGDSGSPFQVRRRGRWYLHGVFTRGERHVSEGKFDFFTRVENYVPWIENHLNNDVDDLEAHSSFGSITEAHNLTVESNDVRVKDGDDFDSLRDQRRIDTFPLWGSNNPTVIESEKVTSENEANFNLKTGRSPSAANTSISRIDIHGKFPTLSHNYHPQTDIDSLIDPAIDVTWNPVTYKPNTKLHSTKSSSSTSATGPNAQVTENSQSSRRLDVNDYSTTSSFELRQTDSNSKEKVTTTTAGNATENNNNKKTTTTMGNSADNSSNEKITATTVEYAAFTTPIPKFTSNTVAPQMLLTQIPTRSVSPRTSSPSPSSPTTASTVAVPTEILSTSTFATISTINFPNRTTIHSRPSVNLKKRPILKTSQVDVALVTPGLVNVFKLATPINMSTTAIPRIIIPNNQLGNSTILTPTNSPIPTLTISKKVSASQRSASNATITVRPFTRFSHRRFNSIPKMKWNSKFKPKTIPKFPTASRGRATHKPPAHFNVLQTSVKPFAPTVTSTTAIPWNMHITNTQMGASTTPKSRHLPMTTTTISTIITTSHSLVPKPSTISTVNTSPRFTTDNTPATNLQSQPAPTSSAVKFSTVRPTFKNVSTLVRSTNTMTIPRNTVSTTVSPTIPITIPTMPTTIPTIPTMPTTIPTTIPTMPATIPRIPTMPATILTNPTMLTTIPTTIPTMPNTITTTIPTIPTKIPTTIPTIPTTVPTTIPTIPSMIPKTILRNTNLTNNETGTSSTLSTTYSITPNSIISTTISATQRSVSNSSMTRRPFSQFLRRRFNSVRKMKAIPKTKPKSKPKQPTAYRSHLRHNPPVHFNVTFKKESRQAWILRRRNLTSPLTSNRSSNNTLNSSKNKVASKNETASGTGNPLIQLDSNATLHVRQKRQVHTTKKHIAKRHSNGDAEKEVKNSVSTTAVPNPLKQSSGQDACVDTSFLSSTTRHQKPQVNDTKNPITNEAKIPPHVRRHAQELFAATPVPIEMATVLLQETGGFLKDAPVKDNKETNTTTGQHEKLPAKNADAHLTTYRSTNGSSTTGFSEARLADRTGVNLTTETSHFSPGMASPEAGRLAANPQPAPPRTKPRHPSSKITTEAVPTLSLNSSSNLSKNVSHTAKHKPHWVRPNPARNPQNKPDTHNESRDVLSVSVSASFSADKKLLDRPRISTRTNPSKHVTPSVAKSSHQPHVDEATRPQPAEQVSPSMNINVRHQSGTVVSKDNLGTSLSAPSKNETRNYINESESVASVRETESENNITLKTETFVGSVKNVKALHPKTYNKPEREYETEIETTLLADPEAYQRMIKATEASVLTSLENSTSEVTSETTTLTTKLAMGGTLPWKPTLPPCFARRRLVTTSAPRMEKHP